MEPGGDGEFRVMSPLPFCCDFSLDGIGVLESGSEAGRGEGRGDGTRCVGVFSCRRRRCAWGSFSRMGPGARSSGGMVSRVFLGTRGPG